MECHLKKSPLQVRLRVTARPRWRDAGVVEGGGGVSKVRLRQGCVNSVRKLQRREIGGRCASWSAAPPPAPPISSVASSSRNIQMNQLNGGFPLFETESLTWPGFVEFDDVNAKVQTFSADDGKYKVFDLKTYNLLYSITDKNVQEIKISTGSMLLIFHRKPGYVPLKILSIEDGTL